MKKWLPLLILVSAQFVMVLDSSVMNVSITQIVADLDTTIEGVQLAITAYTLVMAAFMLVGAKLGDIWGRNRAFAIGLAIYGLGSLTTAFSPNLATLLVGWSLIEGLGAVLVIPAIAALVAANYAGKDRAFAFAMVGAASAVAVAAGPLIGGWVTTTFTWRLVFAGETVVVILILLVQRTMRQAPKAERRPHLDLVGAGLSALGLGLVVYGILKSSEWGWIEPKNAPTVNGTEITPLGFSVVPFLVLGGLVVIGCFALWSERRERRGLDALFDLALLKIARLRAGLETLLAQQLLLMGTFFVLPVYLQVVLGFDAFETGVRLLPLSIAMLVAAISGPKLAARLAPRPVVQMGLAAVAAGAAVLTATVDIELNEPAFKVALALFGVGAGLLASQLGNVIMSSVGPERSSEAGGLQGTAQNLGASLGTALIGAVLLAGLATGFTERVQSDPSIPADVKAQISAAAEKGIDIVPVEQAEAIALEAGLPPDQAAALAESYGEAEIDGLKRALGAVAFLAILAFWFTRRLPGKPEEVAEASVSPRGPPVASA